MARSASIPRFGLDAGQFGVLILGRRFSRDLTQDEVKAVHKTTDAWRLKTGLALAFVSPGPVETAGGDMASESFFAGLLIAAAKEGGEPVKVDKALLNLKRLDAIPAEYWKALEEDHELVSEGDESDENDESGEDEDDDEDEDEDEDEDDDDEDDDDDDDDDDEDEDEDDDDDDEGPSKGIFLVPAGWAVASLYLGSIENDALATTSSEDTTIGVWVSEKQIAAIKASKSALILVGAYC